MKKIFYLVSTILLLSACSEGYHPDPLLNHVGGIVYEKNVKCISNECSKIVENKYTFVICEKWGVNNDGSDSYSTSHVDVFKYDYDRYKVGDTIKVK